jgi:predicted transcriptional regulator/transcriptional regulator with XRE-family HTH domain
VAFDPIVFGHRLRHHRRARGLTLEALGELVGRPAPYLSLVENGKREPKMSQIETLATALNVSVEDLLAPEAPNRRARLEMALESMKDDPRYRALGLSELRPTAKVPDAALEHVVALFEAMTRPDTSRTVDALRNAVGEVGSWLAHHGGYLEEVERAATQLLAASGHDGQGAVTSRDLNAIVSHIGYVVNTVNDVPAQLRSIVDEDAGVIYVAQRNSLRTRQARKAILQTVAARVLGHSAPTSAFDRQRQRLEEAYFAAAVLVPELPAVTALSAAKRERDLSVEDIKERFYVSYEMAAQRLTNLATRHLDIETHFLNSDRDGVVWKAYENDGFPLPRVAGAAEGQRLCRELGARSVYRSQDRFDIHYQFTDTPAGSYWSATHLMPDAPARALTTGVRYSDARWFRGRRTSQQSVSRCPDESCCRSADGAQPAVRTGSRQQSHLVTVLSGDTPPPLEGTELAEFLGRHPAQYGTTESDEIAYRDSETVTQEDVP